MAAPVPPPRKINTRSCQLHLLNPDRIGQAERRPWHPAELVAILGDQRGRHWQHIGITSYSPDGKQIATLAGDSINGSFVYIWEAPSLRFQALLPIRATFMQFLPHGNILQTCSDDGSVRLWDVSGAKPKGRLLLRGGFCAFLHHNTFGSPNGKKLINHSSSTLDLYDLSASPPNRIILPIGEDMSFCGAAFSTDSRTLAILTANFHSVPLELWIGPTKVTEQKVTLWDVSGARPKRHCVLDGPCGEFDSLMFSPDNKTLVVGSTLWDISHVQPKFRASMIGQGEKIHTCVFTPDGRHAIMTTFKDDHSYLSLRDMHQRIPRVLQSVRITAPYCGA